LALVVCGYASSLRPRHTNMPPSTRRMTNRTSKRPRDEERESGTPKRQKTGAIKGVKVPHTRARKQKPSTVEDEEGDNGDYVNNNDNEESASKRRPQKGTKQEKLAARAADILEDMEDAMDRLQQLPPNLRMDPGISSMPRDLLNPETSITTLDSQLEKFRSTCKDMLQLVTSELSNTRGTNDNSARKRVVLSEGEQNLAKIIEMADGMHILMPINNLIN
jgi:hypothetical protein